MDIKIILEGKSRVTWQFFLNGKKMKKKIQKSEKRRNFSHFWNIRKKILIKRHDLTENQNAFFQKTKAF